MAEVALVTGASAGIGAEFARQLSEKDYEVVLVARRKGRLEALAGDLRGPARVIACDLAHDAASLAPQVAELGIEVDVLVNNAGFGTHGRFTDTDAPREAEEVRLNCEALRHAHPRLPPGDGRAAQGRRDHGRLDGGHATAPLRGRLQRLEGVRARIQRRDRGRGPGHGRRRCSA